MIGEPRTLPEALKRLRPAQSLTVRQAVFDELLTHLKEAQETLWSGQGYDATDMAGVRGMPAVWTRSYRELEQLLKRMRSQGQQQSLAGFPLQTLWWHLAEWYLNVERFQQWPKKYKVTRRGGEVVEIQPPYRLVVRRHKDVKVERVKLALDWLDSEWSASVQPRLGEPMVPDEILAAHLPGDDVIRKVRAAA